MEVEALDAIPPKVVDDEYDTVAALELGVLERTEPGRELYGVVRDATPLGLPVGVLVETPVIKEPEVEAMARPPVLGDVRLDTPAD